MSITISLNIMNFKLYLNIYLFDIEYTEYHAYKITFLICS